MPAELLRHQSSRAYYNHNPSCLWGLLPFLDLDKHRHMKKMLSYRRHGEDKHRDGIKLLKSDQISFSNDQDRLSSDKDANLQLEGKTTATKKSSGMAHLITLLYKKLMKKKLKNSPSSAARLLRTISMHHLESDYVPPREASDTSTPPELKSHDEDSSVSTEQAGRIQSTVSESLQDVATVADMEQTIKDVIKGEHRISMDGVLDKVPLGHKLTDDAERDESHGRGSPRSRFGSEGFVFANSKHANRSLRRSHSLVESLDMYSHLLESSSFRESLQLLRSNSVKEQDNNNNNLTTRRVLRSRSLSESLNRSLLRSNSVKEEDGSSARRRGLRSRSLSESLDRYSNLLEFISDREPPQKPRKQDGNFAHRGVPRSRSLSDSFDRYHLLESISVREHHRPPQRSNSVKEQDNTAAHGRVQRSRSLSESLSRYSQLPESVSVVSLKRQPERLKSIREEGGLQMDSEGILSLGNHVTSDVSNVSSMDSGMSDGDARVTLLVKTVETDTFAQHNEEESSASGATGVAEEPELSIEPAQNEEEEHIIVSNDLAADDSHSISHEEDLNVREDDMSKKPLKQSPVSLLDSYFEEDPVSTAMYTDSQGTELQSDWMQLEELGSNVSPENNSQTMELVKADSGNSRSTPDTNELNFFSVKEQPEFNYVKDVLCKSGFVGGTEEFLAVWCSSYEPVDQLIFIEAETTKDDSSDMLFDHRLLQDLINEVLLEIYDSAIASSIGFLSLSPRVRPVPMGDQLVNEVWEKVGWHLGSQQQTSYTLEHVEARDYARDDRWTKLQWGDVERVGVYLEGMILEDLVEEIIVDFGDA